MKYNYNLDFENIHPSIKEKINSPQFPYSEKILDKRIELGFDYEKMADISGVSFEDFIRMENSDININVTNYVDALVNIEIYENQGKLLSTPENNIEINITFNNDTSKVKLSGGAKCPLLAS